MKKLENTPNYEAMGINVPSIFNLPGAGPFGPVSSLFLDASEPSGGPPEFIDDTDGRLRLIPGGPFGSECGGGVAAGATAISSSDSTERSDGRPLPFPSPVSMTVSTNKKDSHHAW